MRFGKTLLIQEMDTVEPILYPLLRGDLIRFVMSLDIISLLWLIRCDISI